MKELGSRTKMYNSTGTITMPLGGSSASQVYGVFALYSQTGTDVRPSSGTNADRHNVGMGDLGDIFFADGEIDGILHFGSAIMDLTFTNSGGQTMELDCYDMVVRKHTARPNFNSDHDQAQSNTAVIGTQSPLNLITRGVTPFDMTELTKMGFKILTKKKFLLSANQACTYQLRDPRNRKVDGSLWKGSPASWTKAGFTRFILAIGKNVNPIQSPPSLTYGVTRKYMYKVLESNEDRAGI